MAPAAVSEPVLVRLHAAVTGALRDPEVAPRLEAVGYRVVGNTPAEFSEFIKKDIVKWAKVVKDSGAKAD